VAISDVITMIGAGMTIKYFNLYWKNDWNMSPVSVLAISVIQPLSIAFFIKVMVKPSQFLGRAQASLFCFSSGVLAMVVLAKVGSWFNADVALPIALMAYFVRSGMANATSPYNKSIVFDFTPSSQRGRWNAVETLCGGVWSGSAFIGGYMADRYDYSTTFLITAVVYAVACLVYAPLVWIVPKQSTSVDIHSASEPLLTPNGSKRMKSPAVAFSPGAKAAMSMGVTLE